VFEKIGGRPIAEDASLMSSALALVGMQNVIAESASIVLNSDFFGTKPNPVILLIVGLLLLLFTVTSFLNASC
jgi:hypothetical protein